MEQVILTAQQFGEVLKFLGKLPHDSVKELTKFLESLYTVQLQQSQKKVEAPVEA